MIDSHLPLESRPTPNRRPAMQDPARYTSDLAVDHCPRAISLPPVSRPLALLSLFGETWCSAACQANAPRVMGHDVEDLVVDRPPVTHHRLR
jgi:hypothetical protein